MKAVSLNATKREKGGKGASRAIRLKGFVPAVVYGDKLAPEMIAIEEKVLVAEMNKKGIWTRQYEIAVDGNKHLVLCQDIQKHPVSNRPIHADFLRISKTSLLTLDIPLHFVGEDVASGFKKGGVLNIVHRTVEVKCTPDNIPEFFELDMSKAEIGDAFNASDIKLPEGVKLTAKEDFTVASVVTPQEEIKETTPAATTAAAATPAEGAAAAPAEGAAAPAADAPKAEEKK